jgi:hypothetical protein
VLVIVGSKVAGVTREKGVAVGWMVEVGRRVGVTVGSRVRVGVQVGGSTMRKVGVGLGNESKGIGVFGGNRFMAEYGFWKIMMK